MIINTKTIIASLLACMACPTLSVGATDGKAPQKEVYVTIDPTKTRGEVSKMLTGVNMIYCFEADERWAGDPEQKMTGMLKRMKTGIIRYPGGAVVEAWHWNQPNGSFTEDVWNSERNLSKEKTPEEYMDLEEYMQVIRATGAEPLVGVNISSGKLFKTVEDGLELARGLVRHCLDKNYGVKYYYVGNEPYHNGAKVRISAEQYAIEINRYAEAIHSVDPSAKIVANWDRKVASPSMKKLLRDAGKNIDLIDVHWYWNWGHATWNNWLKQFPMNSSNQFYADGLPHNEEIARFNEVARELGMEHVKLCSLEWNVGPISKDGSEKWPTEFQCALMQGEMLMQFMDGGLEMATFWPMSWPKNNEPRHMLDAKNNYKERCTPKLFEMMSPMLGGQLVKTESEGELLYSVAVKDAEGNDVICILNKYPEWRKCHIKGLAASSNYTVYRYHQAKQKWTGQFTQIPLKKKGSKAETGLPPYSIIVVTNTK